MTFTKVLAASLAILATQAHGMTLSSRGVGQVLIYPYYTVNNHQQTMFSLTNATTMGKAVQVTFREGYDGRVVYAQEVYLGSNQSWSASVFALRDIDVENDGVGIATQDTACVQTITNSVAKTTSSGLAYHTFDTSSYTGANADGGPTTDARTHEGFFEVIELGQIGGDTAAVISPRNAPTPDCSVVVPFVKMLGDVGTPIGGLSGSAAVINVAQGTFFEFEPKAIDGFRVQRLVPPALADLSMAGDDAKTTVIASIEYGGNYLTATFPRNQAIDAVSSLFMASSLTGDFDDSEGIAATTDWVLTFPTKQFYVDNTSKSSVDVRPFEKRFSDAPAGSSPVANYYSGYSRDGYDLVRNWCGFGECPPNGPRFDFQTKVASFVPRTQLDRSPVLDSALVTAAPIAPDEAGTATINFTGRMKASIEGYVLDGLPVIGVQAIQYVNGNVAAGVLSNYSGTASLRSTLDCEAAMGCR
jgi:hypothetical protein